MCVILDIPDTTISNSGQSCQKTISTDETSVDPCGHTLSILSYRGPQRWQVHLSEARRKIFKGVKSTIFNDIYKVTPMCGESYKMLFTGAPSWNISAFSLTLSTSKCTDNPGLLLRHVFHDLLVEILMQGSFKVYRFCSMWRCLSFV